MELTHKSIKHKYTPDSLAVYLNKICIAEIYYGNDNSKSDSKLWRATMKLPSFKNKTVKVSGTEEGKAHVERCLSNWLDAAGLQLTNKPEGE